MSRRRRCRAHTACQAAAVAVLAAVVPPALAQYEVPNSTYGPGTYYNTIDINSGAFKADLNNLIDGHTSTANDYENAKVRIPVLDADPANPANVLLVYSGYSVQGEWVTGGTIWNREHLWCDSYGINGSGTDYGDLFNLRPSDPGVNSDRSNEYYFNVPVANRMVGHADAPLTYENNTIPDTSQDQMWEPRAVEKGDIARSLFYMDTRYDGADSGTTDLTLTNNIALIATGNSYMGHLNTLLQWHYQDGITNAERKRNDQIHDLYQGNRNPFVDHPEWVWSVFGGAANTSKLYVGASSPSDGMSATTVNLRVMKNGTWGSTSVTLNKTGTTPTTYDITATGSATSTAAGTGQGIDYGSQSRAINVGLNASTATTGLKSGAILIDNTDITAGAAAGQGALDGNDTINVVGQVLDNRVVTASTAAFGRVIAGTSVSANTTLSSPGSDDSNTRVTVLANASAADGNGVAITAAGVATTFDGTTTSAGRSLSGNFATTGSKSGSRSFSLSGEGLAGESVQPLNVAYTATAVARSQASLLDGVDTDAWTIDLGYVRAGFAPRTEPFLVHNLPSASGAAFTAGLDVDSVDHGGSPLLGTNLVAASNIAAGSSLERAAIFTPDTVPGAAQATHTINVSDEDIPGAAAGTSLVLTTRGRTFTDATFPVNGFLKLLAGETLDTGPFEIQGGVILEKNGPGTMNVSGPQSNGPNSVLAVTDGAANLATDAGTNLAVQVEGATTAVTFNESQHLRSLLLSAATVRLAADGTREIVVPTVTLYDDAKLDISDNKLIATSASTGTWNGSAYTGVTGQVESGRNGGAWNGAGIITSQTLAVGSNDLTTIGVATASEILGIAPDATSTWRGEAVEGNDVLAAYTWGGDANLDGKINVDDYGQIDFNVAGSGSVYGWYNGDFNYDGKINVDDYGIIDFNVAAQTGSLGGAASLTPGLEGAAAVPEPASAGVVIGCFAFAATRRRRRSAFFPGS